ncbi:DUF1253-domain-containing protein [Atractiella rhizophila]|nr:DUF1253-domain-containing protein [Atractiella rhizophila]
MAQQLVEDTLTGLVTTLNSSAGSRKRTPFHKDWSFAAKKRKLGHQEEVLALEHEVVGDASEVTLDSASSYDDAYIRHFGSDTPLLKNEGQPFQSELKRSKLGVVRLSYVQGDGEVPIHSNDSLEDILSSYRDVSHLHVGFRTRPKIRQAVADHLFRHLSRSQAMIQKNTTSLLKGSNTSGLQDQGFTRPKILMILPFRNSAPPWISHLSSSSSSKASAWANLPRFRSEFALPDGAVDKLVLDADSYPDDHVENMKGNIDDEFRVGVAYKGNGDWKMWTEFYKSDLIVASPLGLRTTIEKDGTSDFLSSIEIVVVDQLEAILMQNWEHLQFIFDRLNKVPKETRDADFSRIKPWYLDEKSPLLRQTILLSALPSPEIHAIERSSQNMGGKVEIMHAEGGSPPLQRVAKGLRQIWHRLEVTGNKDDEDDTRFQFFCEKIMADARASPNRLSRTLVYVPSSFDFERIKSYMSTTDISFTLLSEDISHSEIARARQQFFHGKVDVLILTERFHFFRRYRIRGVSNIIFYSLPTFPHFYSELLSFVSDWNSEESIQGCQIIFSKYDVLRVKGIVGSKEECVRLFEGSENRFLFV